MQRGRSNRQVLRPRVRGSRMGPNVRNPHQHIFRHNSRMGHASRHRVCRSRRPRLFATLYWSRGSLFHPGCPRHQAEHSSHLRRPSQAASAPTLCRRRVYQGIYRVRRVLSRQVRKVRSCRLRLPRHSRMACRVSHPRTRSEPASALPGRQPISRKYLAMADSCGGRSPRGTA